MGEANEPTLKRLQNLENASDEVPEQIRRLEVIAFRKSGDGELSQARSQWALRWLLKKFYAKSIDGSNARSSHEAWRILQRSIQNVANSVIAQALNQYAFLDTLAITLEENYGKYKPTATHTNRKGLSSENDGVFVALTKESSNYSVDETSSKRRKLSTQVSSAKNANLSDEIKLLVNICRVLQQLLERFDQASEDATTSSLGFLGAALRPDAAQAARILRGGLTALSSSIAILPTLGIPTGSELITYFQTFLRLWERQKARPGCLIFTNDAVHDREALISTLLSLCQVRLRLKSSSASVNSPLGTCASEIERFVAKYYVSPLQKGFQSLDREEQIRETSYLLKSSSAKRSPFEPLISSLKETEIARATSEGNEEYIHRCAQTGVAIFELALKCTALESPKQRAPNIQWLRFLTARALELYEQVDLHASRKGLHRDALEELLSFLAERKLTLEDSQLIPGLFHHAGVTHSNDRQATEGDCDINWNMVALTMSLTPRIFVPSVRQNVTLETGKDPLGVLIHCISLDAWWSVSSHKDDSTNEKGDGKYSVIRDKVIPQLLQGYVSARSQNELLSVWYEQLTLILPKERASGTDTTRLISVWTDPSVSSTISSLLTSSISTAQKVEMITSLRDEEPSGPAMTVLQSLLQGLRPDEATIEISNTIEKVITRCLSILRCQESDAIEKTIGWRTLTSSFVIWASQAPPSSFRDFPESGLLRLEATFVFSDLLTLLDNSWHDISDKCESTQIRADHSFQEALAGLVCVSTIIQTLSQRHIQSIEKILQEPSTSKLCGKIMELIGRLPECEVHGWLTEIVGQFPFLLVFIKDTSTVGGASLQWLDASRYKKNSRVCGISRQGWSDLYPDNIPRARNGGDSEVSGKINEVLKDVLFTVVKTKGISTYAQEMHRLLSSAILSTAEEKEIQAQLMDDLRGGEDKNDPTHWIKHLSLLLTFRQPVEEIQFKQFLNTVQSLDHMDTTDPLQNTVVPTLLERLVDAMLRRAKISLNVCLEVLQDILETSRSREFLVKPYTMLVVGRLIRWSRNLSLPHRARELDLVEHLHGEILEKVVNEVKNLQNNRRVDALAWNCAVGLDLVATASPNVLRDHPSIEEALDEIETFPAITNRLLTSVLSLRWEIELARGQMPSLKAVEQVLTGDLTHAELQQVRNRIEAALSNASLDKRELLLASLTEESLKTPCSASLLRLTNLLLTAPVDWSNDACSYVFSRLTTILATNPSYTLFTLSTSTMQHILTLKSTRLTQNSMEFVLAALTTLVSPLAPGLERRHPRKIYSILCQLVHSILARNGLRKRLRGRAHLLLPILQGLMRALYVPLTQPMGGRLRQPAWLGIEIEGGSKLLPKHASAFARLLTLLCDPPLSAVSSASASRNKASLSGNESQGPLTDPLISARVEAAHAAPLLLGELANCVLWGRYCNEGVREAMQPGVWTLIGVVSSNGMGIDNLGSICGNEGQREVLRALISEWKRVGGGR